MWKERPASKKGKWRRYANTAVVDTIWNSETRPVLIFFYVLDNYQIAYFLKMIFDKVHLLFRVLIHNHKVPVRIRILQNVTDPYDSGFLFGSTTLLSIDSHLIFLIIFILLSIGIWIQIRTIFSDSVTAKTFGFFRIHNTGLKFPFEADKLLDLT
jgi:hypothetical protein